MKYLLLALAISTPAMADVTIMDTDGGRTTVVTSNIQTVTNKAGRLVYIAKVRYRNGNGKIQDENYDIGVEGCENGNGIYWMRPEDSTGDALKYKWFSDSARVLSKAANEICKAAVGSV